MAQACASRSKRRARAFESPAAVAKKSTGHAELREHQKSLHPELYRSEFVECAFQRLSFDASKSQAERRGVSCKLIEWLRFIRWLRFDKAAREITGQICAYPGPDTRVPLSLGASVSIESKRGLSFYVGALSWTANRRPVRWKTHLANKRGTRLRGDHVQTTIERRDDEIITPEATLASL